MKTIQLDIAMPVALERSFTYLANKEIPRGCRVSVPFGPKNRVTIGVVLGNSLEQVNGKVRLKSIVDCLDEVPIYSHYIMELAQWVSVYYMHPIGEVLRSMLPASQVKKRTSKVKLTEAGKKIWLSESHAQCLAFRIVWKRAGVCTLKNFQARILLAEAASEIKLSLSKLLREGLVCIEDVNVTSARKAQEQDQANLEDCSRLAVVSQELTTDQKNVLGRLISEGFYSAKPKPYLLHGVTGAGKTEVYLHLIAEVLGADSDHQVLVMVPEIALTPQMTRIFTARFPGMVSVVHSAMSDAERWSQIESIRQGGMRILIGPRSAVFAPFRCLKLIVVDEEHDTSYKQATGLRYNGRDVAVMRGHFERVLVVLGSATPALESYANTQLGKYILLELPHRVHGRGLPHIELIQPDLKQSFARKLAPVGRLPDLLDLPIDPKIIEALKENHTQGMQAMVIVNRRGFAYFLYSLRERKAVSCPYCSISLTVHQQSTLLRCHYCDYSKKLHDIISPDDRDGFVMVGYGSEQMELFLRQSLPGVRIQRVDADAVANRSTLPIILENFRNGTIDVLVGTQMLAKGHDFAKVTLICILEIDQVLSIPDFRAGERAFQLMVQASGRAGRGEFA